MKTLEQIRDEVGGQRYAQWNERALRELSAHPRLWEDGKGRAACIYEAVIKLYDAYCKRLEDFEAERVAATRNYSDNYLLWEGE